MHRITLKRSKLFRLRKPADRGMFFDLVTKLLWYLCSGKSHVGFCRNYDTNPLYHLVMAIDYFQLMASDIAGQRATVREIET